MLIKKMAVCLVAVICFTNISVGLACAKDNNTDANSFTVNYLSVGEGDSILINLPDGKIMLIDCGENTDQNFETFSSQMKTLNSDKIDYLVLTHTDSDHTGLAERIISGYTVEKAYIPYIINLEKYTAFNNAYNKLKQKGVETVISAIGNQVLGEEYFFCFLSPDFEKDYDSVNFGEETADNINSVSAVIYLDVFGTRFLFTGDINKAIEERIVDFDNAGLYSVYGRQNVKVNLRDIDFLKVSHHGGREEISDKFYNHLNPKNAVISVGAINPYDHPSNYTLIALSTANPEVNILRTDVLGNISVKVNEKGYQIRTEAD